MNVSPNKHEYFTEQIIKNLKIYTHTIEVSPVRTIENHYFPLNPVTVHPA
jgi:hypothetical protein